MVFDRGFCPASRCQLEVHRKSVLQITRYPEHYIQILCVLHGEAQDVKGFLQCFVIKSNPRGKKESLNTKFSTKYFSFNQRKAYILFWSDLSAFIACRKYHIFCKAVLINAPHQLEVGLKPCLFGMVVLYTHFKTLWMTKDSTGNLY